MVSVAIDPLQVPAAYPHDLVHGLTLRDGRRVHVRPVVPEDRDAIQDALRHADVETVRNRFLGSAPSSAGVDRFVNVDYRRRLVLVAVGEDKTGVAVAQYDPTSRAGVAEVAIAVDPRWRGVGLGSALLAQMARAAVERGYHTFVATILADNAAIWNLLRASGVQFETHTRYGVSEIVIDLARTMATRAAD